MDQNLLRSYFGTIYELPMESGIVRASIDGDAAADLAALPPVLRSSFAIVTAYNPRSMPLPRRVNEGRQQVLRDLLVLGCYRVEQCVGYDEEPEGPLREPAWFVQGIPRDEAIAFGRIFRQNTIVFCQDARPELIVTDLTLDTIGRAFQGHWRVR